MLFPMPIKKACNHKANGVALIMAIFIVAFIAVLAMVMFSHLERATYRAMSFMENIKAKGYAEGGLIWAYSQLERDWESRFNHVLIDPPNQHSPITQDEGYRIESTIIPVQNRYNINDLQSKEAEVLFVRLVQSTNPTLSYDRVQMIAHHIFLSVNRHYPLMHLDTLKLIPGMHPTIWAQLKPYLIALPGHVPVYVDVPLVPVLLTLSDTVSPEMAEAIKQAVLKNPPASVQDFFDLGPVKMVNIPRTKVTTTCQFFIVKTEVKHAQLHYVLESLVERKIKQDQSVTFHVFWQRRTL